MRCGAGRRVLEHPPDVPRALVVTTTGHVATVDPDGTGVGPDGPGEHVEQGGLACAVRADDSDELTGGRCRVTSWSATRAFSVPGKKVMETFSTVSTPQPSFSTTPVSAMDVTQRRATPPGSAARIGDKVTCPTDWLPRED